GAPLGAPKLRGLVGATAAVTDLVPDHAPGQRSRREPRCDIPALKGAQTAAAGVQLVREPSRGQHTITETVLSQPLANLAGASEQLQSLLLLLLWLSLTPLVLLLLLLSQAGGHHHCCDQKQQQQQQLLQGRQLPHRRCDSLRGALEVNRGPGEQSVGSE